MTDFNFQSTRRNANEVVAAISRSADTWDRETSKNLFADNNLVRIDPSKSANDPYDGYNIHAWFRFEGEAADMPAYSRTMFDPSNYQNGYYQITESDVSYNIRYH